MLQHYLAVAFRNARAAPLAFATNVLTLAIGLACFVTVYGFVTFWNHAEQHFANADRIAVLTMGLTILDQDYSYDGDPHGPDLAARYLDEDFPQLQNVARAVDMDQEAMIATGDRALRSNGVAVDPAFLDIFALPFVAGNARTALRSPRSLVLTKEHARQLFGDQDPLGRSVVIGNVVDTTVTGVLDTVPEPSHLGRSASAILRFDWLVSFDVLEAIRAATAVPNATPRSENWFEVDAITYLELPADGSFTLAALRDGLPEFARRHVPPNTAAMAEVRFDALPVRDLLRNSVDTGLFIDDAGVSVPTLLLTLGLLVLIVACVNYANLATARAARRTREVGLRKALGADRAQIARQYLFEAGVLTTVALVLALAGFRLAAPLLRAIAGVDVTPALFAGAQFWAFLGAVIAGVTLAAGAYPALALARVQPVRALRASRQQIGSRALTTVLIGVQFGVASALLIAVTIMALQNAHLRRTGLSAETDPLVLIENAAGMTKVDSATLRTELLRLRQVDGVTEIGAPPWVNLSGTLLSASADPNAPRQMVLNTNVGLDFFSVFDIGLVAGRVLGAEDAADEPQAADPAAGEPGEPRPSQPRPIVVDRAFVALLGFASPEGAIGQLVYLPQAAASAVPLRIVGVVEDKTYSFFDWLGTNATLYRLAPRLRYQVVRVARDDVAGGLDGIDRVWRRLAPNVAISRRFLDEYFGEVYETFLRTGQMFSGLAFLAFAISVTGLFGMATLIAGRRMREVGVRKAHGATNGRMVAMLLASFSKPVVVANVIVWPLAYIAARRYLDTFLAPIPLTPLPFVLSLAITLLIAWLAVGSQTLRAARARPAEVLRYE